MNKANKTKEKITIPFESIEIKSFFIKNKVKGIAIKYGTNITSGSKPNVPSKGTKISKGSSNTLKISIILECLNIRNIAIQIPKIIGRIIAPINQKIKI
jgi:hypothetical protein